MTPILVTQRMILDPLHGERRDALDQRWPEFLAACGLLSVPVPNRPDVALGLAEATGAKGLLLTGGGDLAAYGGDAPERDETEHALIAWARARSLPVLGVCRGMQAIQDLFGVGLREVAGHVACRHPLAGGKKKREVNSYHRLGARDSVPALPVVATAPDGVIEALRHASEPIHGIMWHPEREKPFRAEDIALFREVFPCAP